MKQALNRSALLNQIDNIEDMIKESIKLVGQIKPVGETGAWTIANFQKALEDIQRTLRFLKNDRKEMEAWDDVHAILMRAKTQPSGD